MLGLAPGGVCRAPSVTLGAVSSYLAVAPLSLAPPAPIAGSARDGLFSVTLSVSHRFHGENPRCSRGTLLCGVRTFLIPPEGRDAVARHAPMVID